MSEWQDGGLFYSACFTEIVLTDSQMRSLFLSLSRQQISSQIYLHGGWWNFLLSLRRLFSLNSSHKGFFFFFLSSWLTRCWAPCPWKHWLPLRWWMLKSYSNLLYNGWARWATRENALSRSLWSRDGRETLLTSSHVGFSGQPAR